MQSLNSQQMIGPFRILNLLGEGGMGSVYRGVRDDDEMQQNIAIKVLKPGMDSEKILKRFSTEREIQGNLRHRNIANLIEGGTTDDGRPYFAMELVEGRSITRYCDEYRLDVPARMKLFGQVCDAVHFAHRNQVVHRDLKPANILVTNQGNVKLLDFGIARILASEENPTATSHKSMTPAYASPEQLAGKSVTTSSDIYALGLLLYELLTGRRPYKARDRTDNPKRPSVAVQTPYVDETGTTTDPQTLGLLRSSEPRKLARLLRGDMDKIVLMALREEPERRYDSARQLADDIQRCQHGFPVSARGEDLGYVLRKWIGRHKLAAMTCALALCASICASLITYAHRQEAKEARLAAEDALAGADKISFFSQEIVAALDPFRAHSGSGPTPEGWLELISKRLDSLAGQPEIHADMLHSLSRVYFHRGELDVSAKLLEESQRIARTHLEAEHPSAVDMTLSEGEFHLLKKEIVPARAAFQSALEDAHQHFGEDHPLYGKAHLGLGRTLLLLHQFDEADMHIQAAVRIFGQSEEHPLELAEAYATQASRWLMRGQSEPAHQPLKESMQLRQEHLGDNHPKTAESYRLLASMYAADQLYEQGEPYLHRARSIAEKGLNNRHPLIADLMSDLGMLYLNSWNKDKGYGMLQEALSIGEELKGAGHPSLIPTLYSLMRAHLDRGEYAQAIPFVQRARYLAEVAETRTHLFDARQVDIWKTLFDNSYGLILVHLERYDEAECALHEALDLRGRIFGENSLNVYFTLNVMGILYTTTQEATKADEILARARFILSAIDQAPQLWDSRTYYLSAITAGRLGNFEEGKAWMDRAIEINESLTGPMSYYTAFAYYCAAIFYGESGRTEDYQTMRRKVETIEAQANLSSGERSKIRTYLNRLSKHEIAHRQW